MHEEMLHMLAPGRLTALVSLGLRGHHPFFEREAILAAFETPDAPVAREDASAVGHALIAMSREPVDVARQAVEALSGSARLALVRIYFRLLERAQSAQPLRH